MNHFTKNQRIQSPILISMPHCGEYIPASEKEYYLEQAFLIEDTDWFIPQLYQKAIDTYHLNYISNQISRYVIDVNRSDSDESLYPGQTTTGLFPMESFDGKAIYQKPLSLEHQKHRIQAYWQPYHTAIQQTLAQIKERYGYAILWDAHSICSEVPRLFSGQLPDFNFGSFDGKSCLPMHTDRLLACIQQYPKYSHVLNGRFKGGFITRHYGKPESQIYAIQLELSQRTYLKNERAKDQGQKPIYQQQDCLDIQNILCDLLSQLLPE
jgi:N-formylglutamate deformylase